MTENTILACECGRPVKHPKTGECGTCYARRWYRENKAVGRKPSTSPVSYLAMLERIRRWRGNIADQSCAVCGEQAARWVYRGGSELELVEQVAVTSANGVLSTERRYASDVYAYTPLCKQHNEEN